ncbi:MAG: transporter substrate-binding domain-containing protein [Zoogloeaceae bacterium]|nr:transporter substrate-binding domain-containing protein [Zoogloeaceae bacterium]
MPSRRQFLSTLPALAALPLISTNCLAAPAAAADRSRQLIISYNEDYAPYSFVEDGRVKGILPDILEGLLAGFPNLKISREAYPWRRVQQLVQLGDNDAICTFASLDRQTYALFNKIPVVTLRPTLFFSASNPERAVIEKITTVEQLKAFRLIDQQGNQWAEQTLSNYPNVLWASGHDNIFRMVLSGRGDIHVSLSPIVTRWRLKKLGITEGVISRPAPFVAAQVPFHLGIRKGHPRAADILAALDHQLEKPEQQSMIEKTIARYI